MDRKHRATGKPRGGKREGAGRPTGTTNALELGEVSAVKVMGLRVPESATPAAREMADEAFATLVRVMRGEIKFMDAPMRRAAAKDVREEICGPVAKTVNVGGVDGGPLKVTVNINRTINANASVTPERPALDAPSEDIQEIGDAQ